LNVLHSALFRKIKAIRRDALFRSQALYDLTSRATAAKRKIPHPTVAKFAAFAV
jgi:hypothetical protein